MPFMFRSCVTHRLNVMPLRRGQGWLSISGPQVWNSSTFSNTMTSGLAMPAHFSTIHARPRIFFSTGFPPFALEKCLQSGENQAS